MPQKIKVVILESGPIEYLAKIFYDLRKNNRYDVTLISLTGDLKSNFIVNSYDQRIPLGVKYFKIRPKNLPKIISYLAYKSIDLFRLFFKIKSIKPDIVIGRSNPSWTLVMFKKVFFKKVPFIYFPYDIRSSSYIDLPDIKAAGVPDFEIKAEKYLFHNSDGLLHKGDPDELNHLNEKILGEKITIKYPNLYFFPYCLNDFFINPNSKEFKKNKLSKKQTDLHLVFAGNLGTGEEWVRIINNLLDQKIHFHIYSKTANLSEKEEAERIKGPYAEIYKNPFFHIHPQIPQEQLSQELSKYDFGIFSLDVKNRSEKISTGNKLSSYLEAGIPIFNLSNFQVNARIIDKYKIGINVDPNKTISLKKSLLAAKKKIKSSSIIKARNDLSLKNNLPRFESFLQQVIDYNHNKSKK